MRSLVWGVALAAALASPAAADQTAAEAHYGAGEKKYVAGDYAGAARDFLKAYELDADPAYLFNIAQAYRLAKDCANAATYYRTFLDSVPDAPNAGAVRDYLVEMETCVKASTVSPLAATPVATPPPVPEPPPPPPPLPPPTRRGDRRGLAIGAFGVAALGVVGGVVWQRRVGRWEREREAICAGQELCQWSDTLDARERSLASRGTRDSALSIASFSVAGVALAGGIYLLVRGGDERAVQVVPTTNGALVRGTF